MFKLSIILGCCAAALFAQEEAADKRLRNASDTIADIMSAPDKGIPKPLFDRAKCVVIVPGMKKGAFIVGGEYGRGFATCRSAAGWTGPAAVKLVGGSFGLQLGGDSTDVVLLVMNDGGLKHLLSDKFKIGGDATASVGPVGRDASATTDIAMHAEILSYSRSRGLFAGVSLNGTVVEQDTSEDRKLYGRDVTNHEILTGQFAAPEATRVLSHTLSRFGTASRDQ